MNRANIALLAGALALAAAPARAWRPFGEPSDGKIRPVQKLNDEHKPAEVLARLTPEFLQTLRGTDLRQAYVLLGDSHAALGRPAEALGDYQLGVSLFPKNVDLLTRLAALLHENGLDEQAKPLFQTALLYEPRHWGAHLGLAEIDHRLGFLDRSADHYEVALEVLDKNASVWRDYAEVLIAMHETATADLALRRALELDPRSSAAHVLLAFSRRDAGDLAGAVEQLDAARELGAGIGARRAKALFLLEAGSLEEARAEADAVLSAVPDDGAALWVRARVLLAAGDRAGAESALASVKAVDGRDEFAAKAARALREAGEPSEMKVPFWKMSGAGNDFVLLNGLPRGRSGAALARRLCDRRRGIGADGLLVLSRRGGRTRLDYWNGDGSAAFCGNGSRCAGLWAHSHGWTEGERFALDTSAGPLDVRLTARGRAEVVMPPPKELEHRPRLKALGRTFSVQYIWTGVPHVVRLVADVEKIDVKTLGRALRFHKAFGKAGANVDFASLRDDVLHLRTYERGVEDETLACGTGIVAVAAVARALGKVGDRVKVKVRSGDLLHVSFSKDETRLEGPGEITFQGEVTL